MMHIEDLELPELPELPLYFSKPSGILKPNSSSTIGLKVPSLQREVNKMRDAEKDNDNGIPYDFSDNRKDEYRFHNMGKYSLGVVG